MEVLVCMEVRLNTVRHVTSIGPSITNSVQPFSASRILQLGNAWFHFLLLNSWVCQAFSSSNQKASMRAALLMIIRWLWRQPYQTWGTPEKGLNWTWRAILLAYEGQSEYVVEHADEGKKWAKGKYSSTSSGSIRINAEITNHRGNSTVPCFVLFPVSNRYLLSAWHATDIVAPILRYSISHLDILFTASLLTALLRLPSPSALRSLPSSFFSQAWMFSRYRGLGFEGAPASAEFNLDRTCQCYCDVQQPHRFATYLSANTRINGVPAQTGFRRTLTKTIYISVIFSTLNSILSVANLSRLEYAEISFARESHLYE